MATMAGRRKRVVDNDQIMADLAISNSWMTYKQQEIKRGEPVKKVQQLRQFKLELGERFIEMQTMEEEQDTESDTEDNPPKRSKGKPAYTPMPSKVKRMTGAKHLPSFQDKQSRCRHCHYNMIRTKCTTCNLHLCLTKNRNCYVLFHQI